MPDNIVDVKIQATGAQESADQLSLFASESTQQFDLFGDGAAVAFEKFTAGASSAESAAQPLPSLFSRVAAAFREIIPAAIETGDTVKEQALGMSEAITSFAERTRISAAGIKGSFSLVGGLFGDVAIVGILAELLDKLAENVVEVEHFSAATGMSIVSLTEFKDVMLAAGAPSDNLQQQLQKLARSMEAAREPGSKQAEVFRELGVSTEGWIKQLPVANVVIEEIAKHLANSTTATQDSANMSLVFGKNSTALTAVLKTQGNQLDENMKSHLAHAEAMERAAPAALQLTQGMARLSEEFKTILLNSLPALATGFKVLESIVYALVVSITAGISSFKLLGDVAMNSVGGSLKAISQIAHGEFAAAMQTMIDVSAKNIEYFRANGESIVKNSQSAYEKIKEIWGQTIKPPEIATGSTNTDFQPHDNKAREAQQKELEGQMAHEVAMLELEKKRYEGEEKLGQISAASNVSRLAENNAEILNVQTTFLSKMADLYKNDPTAGPQEEEMLNRRTAAIDRAALQELAIKQHGAEEGKKLNDEYTKSYEQMLTAISEMDAKEAARRVTFQRRVMEEAVSNNAKISQDEIRATALRVEADEKAASASAELYRKDVELQYSLGIISFSQRNALMQQSFAAEQKLQNETFQNQVKTLDAAHAAYEKQADAIRDLMNAPSNSDADNEALAKQLAQIDSFNAQYLSKRQELNNKLKQLNQKEAQQEQQNYQQSLTKITQIYDQFINSIGNAFQQGVMSWVKGTKTFSQAFSQMGSQILESFISTLLQMGVKWAERQLLDLLLYRTTNAQKIATQIQTAAAAKGAQTAAAASQIATLAGVAGAGAYASTAAIPVVGPGLAPAAASTAIAAVMGMETLAFAEKGGIFGADQLAYVHKDEMMLPAPISKGFQSILGGGAGASGGAGGGSNISISHNITAMDGVGLDRVLKANRQVLSRNISSMLKDGHLK